MSENCLYVEPFTFYAFLKSNTKIKHLDVHRTLPFILYADLENNIIISLKIKIKISVKLQQFFLLLILDNLVF